LVADLDAAAHALKDQGISPIRADEDVLVLPPSATGFVPVLVTDRLLPGDPRELPPHE
jgi:hypothetical protein